MVENINIMLKIRKEIMYIFNILNETLIEFKNKQDQKQILHMTMYIYINKRIFTIYDNGTNNYI